MSPRTRRIALEVALVVIGFTLLAVLITWPAAANANSVLPTQGIPWDPAGFTWDLWQRLQEGLPLFGAGSTDLIPPFTVEYPAAFNLVQLVFYGPAVAIAGITSPVVAMNVMIIAGIAFTGMAMYALARWVGCGPGASTWAGAALAISPYVVGKAVVHAPLVNIACFPLLILACLWWNERLSWKRALAVAAAFALAWATLAYYGLIAIVMVAVICGWGLVVWGRRRSWRRAAGEGGLLAGLLGVLVILPVAISVFSSDVAHPERRREELALFGARIRDFITPPPDGWLARGVDAGWTVRPDTTGEQFIIYLGIGVLALAITAMGVAWFRPEWLGGGRAATAARIGSVLAPILAWFSLAWPTSIAGVPLPVPSIAIWNLAPEVRSVARFGVTVLVVLLMAGAILIAAIARRGGPVWRHSVIAAALVITWADLGTALPVGTSPPASPDGRAPSDWGPWAWLREAPGVGAVIEYPAGPDVNSPELELTRRMWAAGQLVHGRRLVDAAGPMGQATDARVIDFGRQVADPTMPGVTTDLATAGVTYATVNPWRYGQLGQPSPGVEAPPPGFAMATPPIDGVGIWKVTAAAQPALAVFRQPGFAGPLQKSGTAWHRMLAPRAVVTTWAPTTGWYRFVFPVAGDGRVPQVVAAAVPPARITRDPGRVAVTVRTGPRGRDLVFVLLAPSGASIGRPVVSREGPA